MANPFGDFYTEYTLVLCLLGLIYICGTCSVFLHILFSIIQTTDSKHISEQ